MLTNLVFSLVLALTQENQNQIGDYIVEMAVEKSNQDRATVKEHYTFEKKTNTKKDADEKTDGVGDDMGLAELFRAGRYRYEVTDLILYNGNPVYVLNFSPQPRKQRIKALLGSGFKKSLRNDILNSLMGTIYIHPEDFGIVRVEAHLDNPPIGIWKISRIYQLDSITEQTQVDSLWVAKRISVIANYSYTFFGWPRLKENTDIEFSNFRLKAP